MEESGGKLDALVFGDTCIDYFHEVDKFPQINDAGKVLKIHEYYGGMGANTAVMSSVLGLNTGLITVMGSDAEAYRKYMQSLGVRLLIRSVFGDTTKSLFFKNNGDNYSFFYKGVTELLDNLVPGKEFSKNLIRQTQCVYLARTYLKLHKKVANLCKQKYTVFNPGYGVFEFGDSIPAEFKSVLKNTDVLILNQHELEHLKKLGFKRSAGLGPRVFIVTKGDAGATIYDHNSMIEVGTYKTDVVDASGAGDAFNAGFIAAHLRGHETYESVKIANAVASFVVEKWGCQTNLPSWDAVMQRYNKIR